jgi:hypothetical protein
MSTNHSAWNNHALTDLYRRLLAGEVAFIVVAGQTVNLWAEYYSLADELPLAGPRSHMANAGRRKRGGR